MKRIVEYMEYSVVGILVVAGGYAFAKFVANWF
jgi:hypothetical protein